MTRWQFQLFNLFFIVLYQNALLVLISLPAWTAYQHRGASFGPSTSCWRSRSSRARWLRPWPINSNGTFRLRKSAQVAAGQDPNPRFVQTGLFRFSRHPNYFFEMAQWWLLFLFGALSRHARSLSGPSSDPFLLTLLFIGSTRFTEKISLSKYPEYALYQRTTSPVIPWRRRRGVFTVQVGDRL